MTGRQTAPWLERSALNWREGISGGKKENKIPGKADGLEWEGHREDEDMGKQMSGRKSRFQDLAHVPSEQGHVDKCPTSSIKNFGLRGSRKASQQRYDLRWV